MEQDPLRLKIIIPEMQEGEKIAGQSAKEVQEHIDNMLKDLNFYAEILELDMGYLEHMQSSNELIADYQEDMGHKPKVKEYSQDEVDKIKSDILKTQNIIKEIHNSMNEMVLLKVEFNAQKEQFVELEKRLNSFIATLITYIPKEQQN